MKITFVVPCFDMSGGNRVIAEYAERLRRRGHHVLAIGRPPEQIPFRRRVKSLLLGRGWPETQLQGPTHFERTQVVWRTLERHRPVTAADLPDADVFVATWWETAEWVASFSPRKGVGVHFVQGDEGNPLWMGPSSATRAQAAHRLPLGKITISRSLESMLRDRYRQSDVTRVPNAVNVELFHAPLRGRQPLPTVGLLYNAAPVKGVDVAARAIRTAQARVPGLRVIAFGVGPVASDVPLPEGAEYHLLPAQERIRELYARCDVWLCGSRSEGFHLPPLEAMACRTPVVSTRVGGPEDLIVDGENGFLVDVGDSDALARGLVRVLSTSEPEWRALSERAYRTATGYTQEQATDRLEAALRRAVQRRREAYPAWRSLDSGSPPRAPGAGAATG